LKRRLFPSYCRSAPNGANRRDTHGWKQTNSAGISRVIGSGILLLLLAAHLTAQPQAQFEWRDASGNVRSLPDLEEILRKHQQWIKSEEKAGTRANLDHANLSGAILIVANLSRASLSGANLTGADLMGADLSGAILVGANLTGVDLGAADLSDVFLVEVRVGGTVFEPKSLPELSGISQAQNLELLTYYSNPAALVQLRKQFEDGGLREQERKITCALKRREAELSWARGTSRRLPGDKGPGRFSGRQTVF
jgi:Pentapeptide repeats (8 copies)